MSSCRRSWAQIVPYTPPVHPLTPAHVAWVRSQRDNGAMALYALGDKTPDIDPAAFVHPDAVIIGDVRVGPESRYGRLPYYAAITAPSSWDRRRPFRTARSCTAPTRRTPSSETAAWSGTTLTSRAAAWRTTRSSDPGPSCSTECRSAPSTRGGRRRRLPRHGGATPRPRPRRSGSHHRGRCGCR